jgi:hypothetical protein
LAKFFQKNLNLENTHYLINHICSSAGNSLPLFVKNKNSSITNMAEATENYDANKIQVLEGLEAVGSLSLSFVTC